jgi:thiol:disulfide interchange protein
MPRWCSNATARETFSPPRRSEAYMRPSGQQLPLFFLCAALATEAWSADLPLPGPPEPKLPELTAPALSTPERLETASDVIPADVAFHVVAFPEVDGSIALSWELEPDIYLYRKSLAVENAIDGMPLTLELPDGEMISDEFFGDSEVYFERLVAHIPKATLNAAPGATLELNLMYQGCLKDVYCYPPAQKSVKVTLP